MDSYSWLFSSLSSSTVEQRQAHRDVSAEISALYGSRKRKEGGK